MRFSRFPLLRQAILLAFVIGYAPCIMLGQLAELKRLTASSTGPYTAAAAQSVAVELVRPLTPDTAAIQALAQWLARKQMDWQDGRTGALDPAKLLAAVNRELGLEGSAAHLQLAPEELQRMRGFLSRQLPGLNGVAMPANGSGMSPFEAFLSVELLVRQKMFNAPTQAPAPGQPSSAGRFTAVGGQQREFMQKVMQAWSKWPTASAGLHTLEKVFDESR